MHIYILVGQITQNWILKLIVQEFYKNGWITSLVFIVFLGNDYWFKHSAKYYANKASHDFMWKLNFCDIKVTYSIFGNTVPDSNIPIFGETPYIKIVGKSNKVIAIINVLCVCVNNTFSLFTGLLPCCFHKLHHC